MSKRVAGKRDVLIRLPESTYEGLKGRAQFYGVSMAELIRLCIRKGTPAALEQLSEAQLEQQAIAGPIAEGSA